MEPQIAAIDRYPVKGLNADPLERVRLSPGEGLPHDREFALTHGRSGFDPAAPAWLPKRHFLMLMRDERLAELESRFAEAGPALTLAKDGRVLAAGELGDPAGRAALAAAVADHMGADAEGPVALVSAPGHMFSDNDRKVVSLINLATVAEVGAALGRAIDPRRFRGNLMLAGVPAWAEFGWIDRELRIGPARLHVDRRIPRCAATNVDPATARRDLNIPLALQRGWGHVDCGIYATVTTGGEIAAGDRLTVA